MRSIRAALTSCCLVCFLNGTLRADTITLRNGDHLRGEILSRDETHLHFQADLLPEPLAIPLDNLQDAPELESEPVPESSEEPLPTPVELDVEPVPAKEGEEKWELPENWNARVQFGVSDRRSHNQRRQELSTETKLAWKGKKTEAEWVGYYHYHKQSGLKSTDRYGGVQRLRHRGEDGFFIQAETRAEVDQVTKKRTQLCQTAGLGYAPISEDNLTVNITPGIKGEVITNAEKEDQNGTAYKAHLQQDFRWQINDTLSVGQALNYSVDPVETEDWDLNATAYIETKVSEDVNLRLDYRHEVLNQTEGAPDKESAEFGASLVWDF